MWVGLGIIWAEFGSCFLHFAFRFWIEVMSFQVLLLLCFNDDFLRILWKKIEKEIVSFSLWFVFHREKAKFGLRICEIKGNMKSMDPATQASLKVKSQHLRSLCNNEEEEGYCSSGLRKSEREEDWFRCVSFLDVFVGRPGTTWAK